LTAAWPTFKGRDTCEILKPHEKRVPGSEKKSCREFNNLVKDSKEKAGKIRADIKLASPGRLAELKALKAAKDRTEAEAKAKILKNNKVTEDEMAKNTKAPNPPDRGGD